MRRSVLRTIILGAVLLLGGITLLIQSCSKSQHENKPNIILIVMDTARADHMSCYGYHRDVTPNIDEFAESATFYSKVMASCSWTLPSHASLFTGKDPFMHGAHNVEGDGRQRYDNLNGLDERHLTLAEALKQSGYKTAALIANDCYFLPRFQLDQGFETYFVKGGYSPEHNEHIFAWLDSSATEPFFLFINYFDTHVIYNTEPRPGFLPEPAVHDNGELYAELRTKIMGRAEYSQELRQKVIDQYDTAFANLDEQIGLLFTELKKRGLYENSMIVLTSDHGEAFGRHEGIFAHGLDVYQELLWVPLIIKAPGRSEHRVDNELITLSDIPQMIFAEIPRVVPDDVQDEFPNKPGDHLVIGENYYARPKHRHHPQWGKYYDRIRTAVYDWPYKFIQSTDGNVELYHLENDPKEQDNLVTELPEVARKMLDELVEYKQSRPHGDELVDPGKPNEKELERLKSLGYIDG